MQQTIAGKSVYVVDLETLPELPITGLTPGELVYAKLTAGLHGTFAALRGRRITYAEALTNAIETGVITGPGKYAIYIVPGTDNYEVYTVNE